jgi:very-short-patch-repair endonuclease
MRIDSARIPLPLVPFVPSAIKPLAISRARKLRRNMTDGERRLWSELREFRRLYGVHVRKQAPIGPYVADFVIHEHCLVIEVDGEHHLTPVGIARDRIRDEWFASQGYRVIRLNTGELSDSFEGCVVEILYELGLMEDQTIPTPNPSPQGGGGPGSLP